MTPNDQRQRRAGTMPAKHDDADRRVRCTQQLDVSLIGPLPQHSEQIQRIGFRNAEHRQNRVALSPVVRLVVEKWASISASTCF